MHLQSGDSVYWNDPDEGACSRVLEIASIEVHGDVVCITEPDGTYIETYCWELE